MNASDGRPLTEQREQELEQALRDLMKALTTNEEGTLVVPFDRWAAPWAQAVAVLDRGKE